MTLLFTLAQLKCPQSPFSTKGRTQNKKTSYLVTLSLKVGGGQDEITLLGAAKIVTRW